MSSEAGRTSGYRYRFTAEQQIVLDEGGSRAGLVSGFHIGDERIAQAFGSVLPVKLADFTDVLAAVHMADRISPRSRSAGRSARDNWCRRLHLEIPVRNPALWQDPAIREALWDTLGYLTDDEWEFDFVARAGKARVSESQHFLFRNPPEPPVSAALFSGGLDSLAGLCQELAARPRDSFVLLSAATSSRLGQRQRELVRQLSERSGRRLRTVVVPLGLHQRGERRRDERSQRTRGFAFTGLGAVTAIAAGAAELAVYENGIGAINLPYTAAQIGTHSTRSSHPLFLRRMEHLIENVTGRSIRLRLPFLLQTKAELCALLRGSGWEELIPETVSCDGFPQRVPGKPQCGVCTSCVLRRQALAAAGLTAWDPPDRYRWDVLSPAAEVPGAKLLGLHAMLDQANRLLRLTQHDDSYRALARQYPQIAELVCMLVREPAEADRLAHELAGMYERYVHEWNGFPYVSPRNQAPRAA
ncbi:MAG: 7-cyano-7-deazaguanine synthase [Gemmatimonadetes bacterium]|nr:7-cyano-7-deazaguanine synthase [Gemmatimonadota bacterium]